MNDGKRQVTDETEPDENPIATIHYENGTELTGKAVTLQDGTVGVRIPNEFFKTALLPDGSMPDGVLSVDIRPSHVGYGLPLTDDMAYMIDHERGEGKGLERIDDDDEENGSAADRPGRPEESGGRFRPHQVVRNSKGWEQPLFP